MATSQEKSENINLAFKGLMFTMAGFAVYKVGQKFGLFDSKDDTDVENANNQASASASQVDNKNALLAFNPNYCALIVSAYNKKFKPKLFNGIWNLNRLTEADFKTMVNQIYTGPNIINDDEDAIYDVFRKITTQWQLSLLALSFSTVYKKDLLNYISPPNGFLNTTQMNIVFKIVKNYPQYRKA